MWTASDRMGACRVPGASTERPNSKQLVKQNDEPWVKARVGSNFSFAINRRDP
jgi:hypothetical protein